MFAGQCLPMGSDGVGECQGRRTKRGGRTGPSSFQSAALPTELPAAPSLETADLHSALETPALRSASADATAHERRLRGDGFGDGFGGDFLLVGRSTGGDSAPVLSSVALSAVGAPGSLRLRVAGSSPASGAPETGSMLTKRGKRLSAVAVLVAALVAIMIPAPLRWRAEVVL